MTVKHYEQELRYILPRLGFSSKHATCPEFQKYVRYDIENHNIAIEKSALKYLEKEKIKPDTFKTFIS